MKIKFTNGSIIKTIKNSNSVRSKIKTIPQDCLNCSQSMSIENDNLFCIIHQKEVKDNEYCKNYN